MNQVTNQVTTPATGQATSRTTTPATPDPVTTEVIRNFMSACADDMKSALFRSAYTPIIYEGRDCAVALLDRDARPLGLSTGVPIFLGNLEVCVAHCIDTYGLDWFAPGDVIALNDPYLQGSHLHDVTVFGPIFHDGALVGFAATRAHWLDVGGMDVGTTMGSSDLFQEGFRLGPTKVIGSYEPRADWIAFLRNNSRFGYEMLGDFHAQVAAIRTGERRFQQMLGRFGIDVFDAAKREIFRQSEELDRAAVAALPDGVYRAGGQLDDDGLGGDPVGVAVTVTVDADRMTVDLAGSSPMVAGAINCGAAQTVSAVRLAFKALINTHLPVTGGTFAPLEVRIPDDCLLNARQPGACEWYFTPLGLLADLIVTALAPAVGDRAPAAHYGDSMVVVMTGRDPRRGQALWNSNEPTAGGWGASPGRDGEDALINLTNGPFKNIPVEVFETKYPVRIEEFSIRADSAGPGRHRGGCGVVRTYRLLAPGQVSVWFDRSVTPAWGLSGGGSGAGPEVTVDGPGAAWSGLKTNAMPVPAGTVLTCRTGGGGGYGPAWERDPGAVARDVRAGVMTTAHAADAYGVVLDADTLQVDHAATGARRAGPATQEAPAP